MLELRLQIVMNYCNLFSRNYSVLKICFIFLYCAEIKFNLHLTLIHLYFRIYSSESSDGSSPHEATGNTSNGVVLGGGGTTAYEFDAKFFQSTIPISGVNDTTANTSPITFDAVGLCGLRATNGGDGGKQDANILPYDGRDK